jgi:hypothetical protein
MSRTPLYRSARPHRSTNGDIAAKVGADLGLVPDAEQQWLLDAIYAEDEPGIPTSSEVVAVAPRQNIKSSTFEIAALTDLFVFEVELAVWTAHQFKTSRKSFEDMRRRIKRHPDYASRCFFRDSHGEEAITLHSGPTLEFHARSGGSGRGFMGVSRITLDEALYLRPADMGALSPTQVTQADAQIRFGSSAGLVGSDVLRGLRARGRSGDDPSLAYVEYGATYRPCENPNCSHDVGTPGCVLDDRELWWEANCAMWAGRITEAAIEKQRNRLTPAEFMREFFSWWEDPPHEGGALDFAKWSTLADPAAERGAEQVFAVATGPDRAWTAVAVAWVRPDGQPQVMLADYRPTTGWVKDRVAELKARWGGRVLVTTAARGLVEDGIEPSQQDQAQAHNRLSDLLTAGGLRHGNEPAMNTAVRAARWRPMGDTRVLDRKGSQDISPIDAAALAVHGLTSTSTSSSGWVVSV